jgi:AcrR family transcriptional regulator
MERVFAMREGREACREEGAGYGGAALDKSVRALDTRRYLKDEIPIGISSSDAAIMARPKNPALRAALLSAAAREFSARGFSAASLSAVAQQAGVTKGGVYFHFRSKEELFFAVLDEWCAGLRGALRPADDGGSGAARMRAAIASFLDYHFRNPQAASLLRVLAAEMRGHFTAQVREDLAGALRALRARMRELLTEGARDGSLFATDPALAAFLLAAAVEGVVQQWLASARDVEPFCHAESLAEALIAPYATGIGTAPGPAAQLAHGEDLSPPF